MMGKRWVLACSTALVLVLSGCSHVVVIDTEPSGGEIYVNGEYLGAGPVQYRETTGWDKTYEIEAALPGRKPVRRLVSQSEWNSQMMIASIGVGLFCFWPALGGIFFARQLPDRVTVRLDRPSSEVPLDSDPSLGARVSGLATRSRDRQNY